MLAQWAEIDRDNLQLGPMRGLRFEELRQLLARARGGRDYWRAIGSVGMQRAMAQEEDVYEDGVDAAQVVPQAVQVARLPDACYGVRR